MTTARVEPPASADERTMLDAWLEYHRATLALKCEGLTAKQLQERAVPPSTLSLLGLVRHMAEVERNWFQRTMLGEPIRPLYYSDDDPDGEFDNVDGASVDEAFEAWHAACERAREVAASVASLDEVSKAERHGERPSLRWIMVHMIEEYARHNGHADFLRERIDGEKGL